MSRSTQLGSFLRTACRSVRSFAANLVRSAGKPERPGVEELEPRRLLFSMTITNSDVIPGATTGSVEATFAYVIPYAGTSSEVGDADPENRVEDFNDEDPGVVFNGQLLEGSFVRVQHTVVPAVNLQVVNVGGPDSQERALRVRFVQPSQQVRFQVQANEDDNSQRGLAFTQVSFDISADAGSAVGLDTDNVRVELVFLGNVVQSFTGQQLRNQSSTGSGIGNFQFNVGGNVTGFDEIRVVSLAAPLDAFRLDNLSFTLPAGNFAQIVEPRIFGVRAVLTGPIGTSVQFLDLYGRDMVRTLELGIRQGSQVTIVDVDDDGVPNFNDGLGRIILRGTDASSTLTMIGGRVVAEGASFAFEQVENLTGLYEEFESAGFGFAVQPDQDGGTAAIRGLPPGPGSVIVGSPYVRPLNDYNPGGGPPGEGQNIFVTSGFNRTDQGIFVEGNRAMGSVLIHGMLFGSSQFTSTLERLAVGQLYGSATVTGDLGSLVVASDAGLWYLDPDFDVDFDVTQVNRTSSQLNVGRTIGEIAIAGRSLLDVTVVGDLNNPNVRPSRDVLRYNEREVIFGISRDADEAAVVGALVDGNRFFNFFGLGSGLFRTGGQAVPFGLALFRNDTILSSEFIGGAGSAVQITGDLGGADPVNASTDVVDVYGFAVDGTQDVVVQFEGGAPYARIVDQDGRTLAALEFSEELLSAQLITFRPPEAGVYYLVISDIAPDTDEEVEVFYSATITGLAPVTLGQYRVAASTGQTGSGSTFTNSINVLNGSVGSLRAGTAYVKGDGQESDPGENHNFIEQNIDDRMGFSGGTFSIPGNLYNVLAGGDFGRGDQGGEPAIIFNIGGDLANVVTGLSLVAGEGGPTEGDINLPLVLQVGGRVGKIDIRGALGLDQDAATQPSFEGDGRLTITTGTRGGNGDIGMIRFGSHMNGDSLTVRTSPGSTIGAFLVSQDIPIDLASGDIGIIGGFTGANFFPGSGSDVRFFDTPQIDARQLNAASQPIRVNQFTELVDDGGGRVRFRIVGENTATGQIRGEAIVLPIEGSQGVAIGRINVDLTGGFSLEIEGVGNANAGDIISIGRIVLNNAVAATSGITIRGNIQVDTWLIEQPTGDGLNFIRVEAPLSDIVAIDVQRLTTLDILTGDLGRTQVPTVGPRLLGPFLGLANQLNQTNLGPLGIPANVMEPGWNGGAYRAIGDVSNGPTGAADDIGSPFDPYLNGLVVRNGNLSDVRVGGAVGDVILQGGELIRLTANVDRVTPAGRFDGIIGSIFANRISLVNVGDGLRARTANVPLTEVGIFAPDDILVVEATLPGAFLSSSIIAGDNVFQTGPDNPVNGIDTIRVDSDGGDFRDLFISAGRLDGFWFSFFSLNRDIYAGDIREIRGVDADFFRSQARAGTITNIDLRNGFYDASFVTTSDLLQRVSATGYRNSTITGGAREFRLNRIFSGDDIDTITTEGRAGDIQDLTIDALGSIITEISAFNITRTRIDVDNQIPLIRTAGGLRGSAIIAGELRNLTVGTSITTSAVTISGLIDRVTAADSIINSRFEVTGPAGQINTITAANLFSGAVLASGPIDRLTATAGDLSLDITTTTARGNINVLTAGRDLDLRTDISGTVNTMTAGRHIGTPGRAGVVVMRGSLQSASAGGTLYSDLRVGQTIGAVSLGAVSTLPENNQTGTGSIYAFGAINGVGILGDFGGNIISYSGGINAIAITNGSFLPGRQIAAYDGHLNSLVITNGSLFGNVHSDWIIYGITVNGAADGVFGHIGINPALSTAVRYDALRNQLPVGVVPTVGVDGPRISAGWNLGVVIASGSAFESTFFGGRAIGIVHVGGSFSNDPLTTNALGTSIVAGDLIYQASANVQINNAFVLAGVIDLGADNRPGGTGANRDTTQAGVIQTLAAGAGGMAAVVITAGVNPGADGIYSTGDDRVAPGVSVVDTVITTGPMTAVFAVSDAYGVQASAESRLVRSGLDMQNEDPDIDPGFPNPGVEIVSGSSLAFTHGSDTGRIFFAGPGQAFWNQAQGRLILRNTTLDSALTVFSDTFVLSDFDIVSNDDASMGSIYVGASLLGDSEIVIDAFVWSLTAGHIDGTGGIRIGGDVGGIVLGNFTAALLTAKQAQGLVISGDLGSTRFDERGVSRISMIAGGNFIVNGAMRGTLNIDRDLALYSVGSMDNGRLRAGASVGSFVAGSVRESRVSIRDFLGAATVSGAASDVEFMIGGDLGRDAEVGGTGLNLDRPTAGFAGPIAIGGDFDRSDVVAGLIRGADGFFGTPDDSASEGRSSIASVSIGGTRVGSNVQSESFRISSTGTIGAVTVAGQTGTSTGNFVIGPLATQPLPLQVSDLRVENLSQVVVARLEFNQPINFSTLSPALSISELRDGGVQVRLVEGADYTLSYEPLTNTASVTFARAVTTRNLPKVAGVPGPGVYRFELSQAILRAQVDNARLDGSGDGFATASDNYSADDFVGDAGDKLADVRTTTTDPNSGRSATIDFYAPFNLDTVLDNNVTPDGLPDANKVFTVRGSIGDHPDNDTDLFRFAGDADVYAITLQAGQIIRLGAMSGAAEQAGLVLFSPNGTGAGPFNPGTQLVALANAPQNINDRTAGQNYLAKVSGQYLIVVSNDAPFTNPNAVHNIDPVPSGVGDYSFTIEVYDDGDSGFADTTDSGDGTALIDAPTAGSFAGPNGVLGDSDDPTEIIIGAHRFTYDRATGIVSGGNGFNQSSGRLANGTVFTTINSAIGPARAAGLPGQVFPDADVFHLNNRLPIVPGTRITLTVKLAQFGSDLGAINQNFNGSDEVGILGTDFRGDVQFGVFQTSGSSTVDDGVLVFSPTDFSPVGGTPNTTIANDGSTRYGFDANGDFFVSFLAPSRFGSSDSTPAAYAVYLQGAYNADYQLEVVTAAPEVFTRTTQNFLIETRGGTVDWLEIGGQVTQLGAFDPAQFGFVGVLGSGQTFRDYILTNLVAQLNSIFDTANVDVQFSTNPLDFEFESYSTVFIAGSTDPVNLLYNSFNFLGFAGGNFTLSQGFGVSEHSDPLNADRSDEAVVFTPALTLLGYTPSLTDLDRLIDSMTAAVGRRAGELMGLRITAPNGATGDDLFASDSVQNVRTTYSVSTVGRLLSPRNDVLQGTDFYLGRQNADVLLDKILRP